MRQLGARLPVPPEEADVAETPQRVPPARPADRSAAPALAETNAPRPEPYPVERHWIEPQSVDSGPAVAPAPPPPPRNEPQKVASGPAATPPAPQPRQSEPERNGGARTDDPVRQTADPVRQAGNPAGHAGDSARGADQAAASAASRAREVESAAAARWAEFHDLRRLEPGRGGRLNFESMLQQDDQSWIRPRMRQESEHHFPFLTLAVPGIAAILAVGALLWSGSLRDRVRQQDAAMNALQEQNHKLADTLAQMNVDQKTASALDGNADIPHAPADTQKDANGGPSSPQQSPQAATTPAATPQTAEAESQPTTDNGAGGTTVEKQSNREPVSQAAESRGAGNRQGVSTPPPVGQAGRMPRQTTGSRNRPVEAAYRPELVPPYPTNFQPQNVAANAAASQPVPNAGVSNPAAPTSSGTTSGQTTSPQTGGATPPNYVPPVSVPSSARASAPQTMPQSSGSQTGVSQPAKRNIGRGATLPPAASPAPATSYNTAADGSYASPLAQNIEAVQGLQRHSPVPLREFHADESRVAKVTPGLGVSVRHPDPRRGTYALVVDEGGKHYQVTGQVNSPLTLSDSAAHREYTLVVLHIDNQQVYGYLRPMQ
ncbi:MAG TPA: hypothetical protein VF018_12710 [Acidobacteriaceae bacterium]